ncbi:MAG: response regulator transcription factor [Clostridia bacterium]|nr:response regulator transcription factor [Clostridia bacterium]
MATVLIVDDDKNICDIIRMYMEKEGYSTLIAYTGADAISIFRKTSVDIIVLDLMLPGINGIDVCKTIRQSSNVPIIMLTAKGETFDKVLGLEMGADDYMVKPFEPRELVARIKAVLRRTENTDIASEELVFPGLSINISTYILKINGKAIDVPKKEIELLYFLASNPNVVYTRDKLLDSVWGYDFLGNSRTVDVHIHRLREKLDGIDDSWSLKTVSGVGYKFELK